jgi:hypothetical protein
VNASVAERAPAAVGTKSTVTVQLDLAVRVDPQVLAEIEKSLAFAPEMATLLMEAADVPSLVSVTACAFPADPTGTLAHERLLGVAVSATAAGPTQPVCCKAHHARNAVRRRSPARRIPLAIFGFALGPQVRAGDIAEKRNETRAAPKSRPADALRRKLSA